MARNLQDPLRKESTIPSNSSREIERLYGYNLYSLIIYRCRQMVVHLSTPSWRSSRRFRETWRPVNPASNLNFQFDKLRLNAGVHDFSGATFPVIQNIYSICFQSWIIYIEQTTAMHVHVGVFSVFFFASPVHILSSEVKGFGGMVARGRVEQWVSRQTSIGRFLVIWFDNGLVTYVLTCARKNQARTCMPTALKNGVRKLFWNFRMVSLNSGSRASITKRVQRHKLSWRATTANCRPSKVRNRHFVAKPM